MKKIFVIVLLGIFLVGMVSAADWDNLKIYNKGEDKITLYNYNIIGLVFDIKLVEYTLDYNTDQCLMDCNSGGTATLYEKGKLFDTLDFKNKKGKEESIEEYNIFIKRNITHKIDVAEYIEVCKIVNGTEEFCETVASGKKHKEDVVVEEWVEYNGENLDEGTYEWKLEGRKEVSQDIDWVFTVRGKKFSNWAWWNGDWATCNDLSIETSETQNNWIAEKNITGLTFDNITELRIVSASCDDGGSEIKSTVLKNGSDWAYMTWLVNSSGSSLNYSIYSNNPTAPAKASSLEVVDDFCEFEGNVCGWTNHSTPSALTVSNGIASATTDGGSYSPTIVGNKNVLTRTYHPTSSNNFLWSGLHNRTVGMMTWIPDMGALPEGGLAMFYGGNAKINWNEQGGVGGESTYAASTYDMWINTFEKFVSSNTTFWGYNSSGLAGVNNMTSSINDVNLRLFIGTAYSDANPNQWDYIRAYDTESEYIFEGLYNITLGDDEADSGIAVSLNQPINSTNFAINEIETNCSVVVTATILNNISLYIDGSLNISGDFTGAYNESVQTLTFAEGSHEWTCSTTDTSDNIFWATTNRTFTVNTTPHIQYESPTPVDYLNSSISTFTVNVSLNETYFQNLTFVLHNGTDVYNSTIITDGTRFINWSGIADGNYTYNATIWTTTNTQNSTATRTITIDSNAAVSNITSPFEYVDYHIIDQNLTINWTVADPHLDSCWGSFDGGLNNLSLVCGDNSFSKNITSVNNDTFTFYTNDSFGNFGSSNRSWIYRIFEVQQTYSPTTIVGSTETFVNNIFLGSGETITEVVFDYNGTEESATSVNVGGDEYNLTSSFIIPSVAAITNMSFIWEISLVTGQINTTARNQTLNIISVDNCSAYTNTIFNYTIVDEENQSTITNNTFLELDIAFFDESKTVALLNFSEEFDTVNPVLICLSIELTNDTVYAVDSTVRYSADNYSIEYYNIQNFLLKNSTIPQEITLYDLWETDATEFQVTFKDSNFVTVEGALIQINRQYLSEGTFKTVEIPKTDSNGQTVAHLVEKDIVYNILVLKEGEVLGTFNNYIAFCEDALIGSCFITLNALTSGVEAYNYDEVIGLYYTFDYNETTRDLRFDFTTTDGSVKNITLAGIKTDVLGETDICNGVLISSSGTILCAVPGSVGNESIYIEIIVDGDLQIRNYISAGTAFDIGDAGYFLMFFLVLSLALMMTQSKTGVIIGVVIGFIAGSLLSFVKGGVLGIGSSIIWLVIMGVILIYKLNSQGQT